MTRRTALMASFAVMGQIIRGETEAKQTSNTGTFSVGKWEVPQALTVYLGGEKGYQRFSFVHGSETITFTAEELFTALKATGGAVRP